LCELVEIFICRTNARGIGKKGMRRQIDSRGLRHRIPGNANQANAALGDCRLNREPAHCCRLDCGVRRFAIVAAIAEQVVRLGFLEVAAADFGRRNMRRDRQHRNTRALAIVKTVDEMEIARAA
jgi:hypothetical protein